MMRSNAILGLVLISGFAISQGPGLLPSLPTPVPDEGIAPAQFVRPVGESRIAPAAATSVNPVAVPVVSLDVIVPQSAATTSSIPCKIVVKNNSNADAYSVKVRVPMARLGASTIDKATPTALATAEKNRNYLWNFPTLRAGESKTISFTLIPDAATANNGELSLKAFVAFEHGVEVITKLGLPKLLLTKAAAKEAATGEAIPVSVQIRNQGPVPLHVVKLTETVTAGFTFAEGTTGEETKNPLQRIWNLGTLQPGETKTVGYRVATKQAGELLASSAVSCTETNPEIKDSITKVMTAGLAVKLTGPRESSPGEAASYTINVRNTGELTMKNVRLEGTIPDGCRATKMTNNGRIGRDRIEWTIPELKPGAAYDVRFALVGDSAGKRIVTATAADSRGKDYSDTRETVFAASADLHWETFAEPATVAVGRSGTFTVRVKNSGGDAARNVVVKMELPTEVRRTTIKPRDAKEGGREIVFKAETIPPGATREYLVEYKAEQVGRAFFNIKLEADALGEKPLLAEKMIVVTQAR